MIYSTVPEKVSWRDASKGTLLVDKLSKAMKVSSKSAHECITVLQHQGRIFLIKPLIRFQDWHSNPRRFFHFEDLLIQVRHRMTLANSQYMTHTMRQVMESNSTLTKRLTFNLQPQ